MNFPWAIKLPSEDADALAPLRLLPGLEIGDGGSHLWLRSKQCDERLAPLLQALPAVARYEWRNADQLRPIELRIPAEKLPALDWVPLSQWLRVSLAGPVMTELTSAVPLKGSRLRLVRHAAEREPDLLLTTLQDWSGFARVAPEVRLRRLQFAVNSERQVFVRGQPLPPLPGQRFVTSGNVASPAGFRWDPAVSGEVLAHCLGVGASALAVVHEDVSFTRLEAEQFVPATRRALRASLNES